MSIIFSQALQAIKMNPEVNNSGHMEEEKKENQTFKHISSRIKKPSMKRAEKTLLLKKKILKKVHIKKKESWQHDKYFDGPSTVVKNYTVFLRNLPENANSNLIKNLIEHSYENYIIGMKVYIYFHFINC